MSLSQKMFSSQKMSPPQKLSVLGATGSIGVNTLDVIEQCGGRERYQIAALTGHSNIELLVQQAKYWQPEIVATANGALYTALKDALAGTDIKVAAGRTGLLEAASLQADWVMAAIVGIAGLEPTLKSAEMGATIALANKECLVCGGDWFKAALQKHDALLLPVDSEHNAIFQALSGQDRAGVEKLVITASGGPFLNATIEEMKGMTPEQAAGHPNWSMGQKISIDSASMFNKALEMIEAKHLFDVTPAQIDVLVHPQSIIHSMVGYSDGSFVAQLGAPDMRTAIGYALEYPKRATLDVERMDLAKLQQLTFFPPDEVRFPSIRLAKEVMNIGGCAGAVFNGAKEAALDAFIGGQICFTRMAPLVESALNSVEMVSNKLNSLNNIIHADAEARAYIASQGI